MEKKQVNVVPPKKDPSKAILIVVILILLGAIGYLVFHNHSKQNLIARHVQEHQEDSLKLAYKIRELEDLQRHYEKLKKEKEQLDLYPDSLARKIEEIEELKIQLRNKKITMNNLNAKLARYQGEFIRMKSNYDSLIYSNSFLKLQRDSLIALTQSREAELAHLSQQKKELAHKIAVASILKAENISVSVVNNKGKEISDDPYRVKTVNKIKIRFNLGENKVARRTSKDIYMRLIEPSGSTLFEGEKVFSVEGKETFYTDKQTIQFDNSKQEVVFLYTKGSGYKPGKYFIELFAEGHKIGESQLEMK